MKSKKIQIDGGFTFVETLAVLAVTAILAGQVMAGTMDLLQKAKVSAAKTQMENYRIALQSYYIDCGHFPDSRQGLESLWQKEYAFSDSEKWKGPYTSKAIAGDPWGNKYIYFSSADGDVKSFYEIEEEIPEGLPFAIISLGADGKSGGYGYEKDIYSWN